MRDDRLLYGSAPPSASHAGVPSEALLLGLLVYSPRDTFRLAPLPCLKLSVVVRHARASDVCGLRCSNPNHSWRSSRLQENKGAVLRPALEREA